MFWSYASGFEHLHLVHSENQEEAVLCFNKVVPYSLNHFVLRMHPLITKHKCS